jgi:hypothetical protein
MFTHDTPQLIDRQGVPKNGPESTAPKYFSIIDKVNDSLFFGKTYFMGSPAAQPAPAGRRPR